MNLQHIQEQAARDIRIDSSNPNKTAVNVPMLHMKYLDLLTDSQLKCIALKHKYDSEYKKKYLYYRNDYNVVLKNKAEIDIFMAGDEELAEFYLKLEYEKKKANYLESLVKQIAGLSFLIRDIIEWDKFKAGGYW